ncbi:hypothetical protein ACOMHN_040244 [Nucella lapillus]
MKAGSGDEVPVFRNTCTIGLTDGYVITLADGVIQTCVTPWTHVDSVYPAFGVTDLLKFSSDIGICLTDTKHCFVIDETAKQVKHHWEGVTKAVVGDFLQCGGQQLLLLFSSCLSQQPPDSFLLTDLQGFVADRRKNSCDDASLSEEIFPAEDDDRGSGNLQPVINALLEQNQALARKVAEEKQKLASKQTFVARTWARLMGLSVHGADSLPESSPTEVPLSTLVGRPRGLEPADRGGRGQQRSSSDSEPEGGDLQVHCIWHRLLGASCVVGVNVTNTSHRELFSCALALTARSASQTTQGPSSARTSVWQCFRARDSQASTASTRINPRKRRKTDFFLRVQQTRSIQPSESVTVTCVFDAPDLGWHGELAYHVSLVYEVRERSTPCGGDVSVGDLGAGVAKQGDVEGPGETRSLCGAGQGEDSMVWRSTHRTRNALCGQVGLTAAQLLQHKPTLDRLVEDPVQLEGLLALSSVQQQWRCDVDFVLHEATELFMAQCLQSAGFVYRSHLSQYWVSAQGPACLQWVRVQLLGLAPLPRRAASVVLFARDSNQLLLLLRHLYTHLPEDATVTLAREDPDTTVRHLVKLLTAQLSDRKTQAQALLETHQPPSDPSSNQPTITDTSRMATDKCVSGESSASERATQDQVEEFAEMQHQYRQNQSRSAVGEEDVGRFKAVVTGCERETDMALAKVKL